MPLDEGRVINQSGPACADSRIEPAVVKSIDAAGLLKKDAGVDYRAMHHLLSWQRPSRFVQNIHCQQGVPRLHPLEQSPVPSIECLDQVSIYKTLTCAGYRDCFGIPPNCLSKNFETIWL